MMYSISKFYNECFTSFLVKMFIDQLANLISFAYYKVMALHMLNLLKSIVTQVNNTQIKQPEYLGLRLLKENR